LRSPRCGQYPLSLRLFCCALRANCCVAFTTSWHCWRASVPTNGTKFSLKAAGSGPLRNLQGNFTDRLSLTGAGCEGFGRIYALSPAYACRRLLTTSAYRSQMSRFGLGQLSNPMGGARGGGHAIDFTWCYRRPPPRQLTELVPVRADGADGVSADKQTRPQHYLELGNRRFYFTLHVHLQCVQVFLQAV
jgi:hypothetical protein